VANFGPSNQPEVEKLTRTIRNVRVATKDDRLGAEKTLVTGPILLWIKDAGQKSADGVKVCYPDGAAVGAASNFRINVIELLCDLSILGGDDGDAILQAVTDDPDSLQLAPTIEGKPGEQAALTGIQIVKPKRPAGSTGRAAVDAAFDQLKAVKAYCEQRFESDRDIRRRFKVPHGASAGSRDYDSALQRFVHVEAKCRAEEADAGRRPAEEATAWALLQKLENGYRDPYTTVR